MRIYSPSRIEYPKRLEVPSAWQGLDCIIGAIIKDFRIRPNKALEFGVEYGFSTYALAQYFRKVVGVDTFEGDQHTRNGSVEHDVVQSIMPKNVLLIKSDYKDYQDDEKYDMIHIDIVHTYADTFKCGEWALKHSNLVIFHDTQSFPEVRRAVQDLDPNFYNYPFCNGLGIIHANHDSNTTPNDRGRFYNAL
jgi:predicted O-methyltransferase YrrM